MQQQQDVTVSQAFRQPPSTAAMFKQSYAASEAGQLAQGGQTQGIPQAEPQPAPQQVFVPNARRANPILPTPQANTQPQAVTQPPSAQEQPEAHQKPVPPLAAPTSDSVLQKQLEMERQAWAAEKAQWQQAVQVQAQQLQQAQQMQQEYAALRQQQELAQQLSNDELFADLQTLDADDARRIVALTTQTLQAPLNTMKQELSKQQLAIQQQQQFLNQQFSLMRQQSASEKLQAAHPDFAQLVHDPAFLQFAQQRDGYTSKTREQMAWEEFNAGNPDYVINMVNQFKGIAPKVENLQTAPPVQVANAAMQPMPQQTAPQFTLAELNNLMQMRQITPDQYRAELNRLRAAQQGQMP